MCIRDRDEEDPVAALKEMRYDELSAACSAVGASYSPVNDGEFYQGTVIDGEFTELAQSYPLVDVYKRQHWDMISRSRMAIRSTILREI